jgi:hypothetical protein
MKTKQKKKVRTNGGGSCDRITVNKYREKREKNSQISSISPVRVISAAMNSE